MLIDKLRPMPMQKGPPLPRGLGVTWQDLKQPPSPPPRVHPRQFPAYTLCMDTCMQGQFSKLSAFRFCYDKCQRQANLLR